MTAQSDRYHALDSLRGFAMFLGVVLHAAISFAANNPPDFWPIRDTATSPLVDVFLLAVHDFRMQLFFLLAGFFGCLLYQRYGTGGMAWHRVKRVAIPFVLGVMLIVPTIMGAFLYAELDHVRTHGVSENASETRRRTAELLATYPDESDTGIIAGRFTSGAYLERLVPAHLWFLYYLLFFYLAVVVLAPLLGRLTGTKLLGAIDASFRHLIEGRWRVVAPTLLTIPVLLAMRTWVVDTQMGWVPAWHVLVYYLGFFAFGWMLYRHRDLVTSFGRGWRTNLAVANLLVLPVALGLLFGGIKAEKAGDVGALVWKPVSFAVQAVYTWLMIVGLWGAFLHYFARERAWVRYMADASYWCYLASITPVMLLQFWVKDWPLPALVKWAFVSTATMALLLVSYEWCVRYTFIGAILNGRKTRAKGATIPQDRGELTTEAQRHRESQEKTVS